MPIFTKERFNFVGCVFTLIKQRICSSCRPLQAYFSRWIKPSTTSLVLGTLADMTKGKSELLAENALLRLCWLLGTSVREIDMMPRMEQAFLTENPRGEYNQQGLYFSYSWQHP